MAGPKEQKWFEMVEELFVFKGLSYDQIMDHLRSLGEEITKGTLSAWNAKGAWNAKRSRYLKSRSGLAGQLNLLLERKLERLLADAEQLNGEELKDLTRLMAAIEKFDKSGPDPKAMNIEVMGQFARYCRQEARPGEIDVIRRLVSGYLAALEAAA